MNTQPQPQHKIKPDDNSNDYWQSQYDYYEAQYNHDELRQDRQRVNNLKKISAKRGNRV